MLKRALPIAFCGALLLSGCSAVDDDKQHIVTGAVAGAAAGGAFSMLLGDPLLGGALIGGLLGGLGGLIYEEYGEE